MTRFQALVVVATVWLAGACGAAADGHEALAEKFESYVCGAAPACAARDISDHSLDYGAWLAARLGVAPLARLRVLDSFYIEAGPGEDGEILSLGAVSFLSPDPDATRAIVTQLAEIPDGAFKDGKVVMRFKPLVEGDRIDLVFTGSFDPRMDRFLASI
jgi:hypothetical protein